MSQVQLIKGSCIDQRVDAIVNAANKFLAPGGGVCGEIFRRAGAMELMEACKKIPTPLKTGDAVMTPAFGIRNARGIIHAVGPDFGVTPEAFDELALAYYHSLYVLKENKYHSIAFPLISSGIYGGKLENPAKTSAEQFLKAYQQFIKENPTYNVDIFLCAYSEKEYNTVFDVL